MFDTLFEYVIKWSLLNITICFHDIFSFVVIRLLCFVVYMYFSNDASTSRPSYSSVTQCIVIVPVKV